MLISFALIFFMLLGSACATDGGNVSSIENSNLLSSDVDMELQTAASSGDVNESECTLAVSDDDTLALSNVANDEVLEATKTLSFAPYSGSTIISGNNFYVKLLDSKKNPVAGKTVTFSFNGATYKNVTQRNGAAYLHLTGDSKYYTITYKFSASGYTTIQGKSSILLLGNSASKIKGSDTVAFVGYKNPFKVRLVADGVNLYNKKVRFVINGKSYYATTNSQGVACLYLSYSRASTHTIRYYYAGERNIEASSGSAVVTFRTVPTKIVRANSEVYQPNVLTPFKVKVVDGRNNPASGKVVFTVNNKKYVRTLNSQGITSLGIRLSAGTYKISYVFYKNSKYNSCSGSCSISVRSYSNNHGFWIFGSDMKNVNLNTLAKYNTKHIFLNYYAIKLHGKAAVETFVKNANAKGIKVHIWMQVFYDGDWIYPVYSDGSYKLSFFKSKINEAKTYASIKGVAGIHLDYLRFPGNAYNYKNGVSAINYFTYQLSSAVHKINSKLIVSAAVMPETTSNKYYYGQDISSLSQSLDVLIPMVYKGNYEASSSWIASTTKWFVQNSRGAQIWTGIQSYVSDDDVSRLSASELLKDSRAAMNGGATGVIIFRWGISNFINFSSV